MAMDPDTIDELGWLTRRLQLIDRAIRELEADQKSPHLDRRLNPDVADSLIWARRERSSIRSRIAALQPSRGP